MIKEGLIHFFFFWTIQFLFNWRENSVCRQAEDLSYKALHSFPGKQGLAFRTAESSIQTLFSFVFSVFISTLFEMLPPPPNELLLNLHVRFSSSNGILLKSSLANRIRKFTILNKCYTELQANYFFTMTTV